MNKKQILLVEDDEDILKINNIHLTKQGYDCLLAPSLEKAFEIILQKNPDLIVLDINLPDGSGIMFCKKIRDLTKAPIIFLSCYGTEEDKVKGLMAGGDDYITKPYGLSELAARIHTQLRRINLNDKKIFDYPPIKIDTNSQIAYLDGEDVFLTPKEFQIFLILVNNIGKTINTEDLYKKVWGYSPEEGLNTIKVHISSIRKKLKLEYDNIAQIKTIRNVGYCFEYEKNI